MCYKSRNIILLSLILLSSLFVFYVASASRVESYITIKKGWNLVYGFTPSSLDGQALDIKNIKAIFAFIPTTQEYARIYPRPENEKINRIGDAYLEKTSMWIYSAVDARTEYWLEEPLSLGEHKFYRGWNFFGVTPGMVGKQLSDIKGSCKIDKAYGWEPDRKSWNNLLDEELPSEALPSEALLMGFVMKVSENCQFGLQEEVLEPPKLPFLDEPTPYTQPKPKQTPTTDKTVFPNQIQNYSISTEIRRPESGSRCEMFGDHPDVKHLGLKGEICVTSQTTEYRDADSNRGIFIVAQKFTKGRDIYEQYLNASTKPFPRVGGIDILRLENHELLWWTASSQIFDLVFTQEFSVNKNPDGAVSYSYGMANGDNPVTKYLISQYPPR